MNKNPGCYKCKYFEYNGEDDPDECLHPLNTGRVRYNPYTGAVIRRIKTPWTLNAECECPNFTGDTTIWQRLRRFLDER